MFHVSLLSHHFECMEMQVIDKLRYEEHIKAGIRFESGSLQNKVFGCQRDLHSNNNSFVAK